MGNRAVRCLKCHADILRPDATDRATLTCRDCRFEAKDALRAPHFYYGGRQ